MVIRLFQAEITKNKLVTNSPNLVDPDRGWLTRRAAGEATGDRGTVMPLIAIVIAALAIGFEQLVQWKYGPMGIIAFVALTVGIKARSTMISGIGAVILVMLFAQSG